MVSATAIRDQVTQALQHSHLPPLRRIAVEQNGDVLVLTGRVQSYYYKQMAQETVLPLLAGRELANQLTVGR